MSKESNKQGRAYEYACIIQLEKIISSFRRVEIISNTSLKASKKSWDDVSSSQQEAFISSANAAIEMLIELEPLITENDDDVLELVLQKDAEGEIGDVRDCVILRKNKNWQIGLSIKHNHFAVKHSRLAKNLDFGQKWFGQPCSEEYWNAVKPVFNFLEEEKKKTKWSEIECKGDRVYKPLLNAFISEIQRSCLKDKQLPRKMVEYLFGCYDFYKIISIDKKNITQIHPYNLHGMLNRGGEKIKSRIIVPLVKLPSRIVSAEFKPNSNNTVEIYLNEGWQINFRIHSASTYVETSLKFDVQIKGMPADMVIFECKWK